jgi:glutaredoxin-related protein
MSAAAVAKVNGFKTEILTEVREALTKHRVVVIGMGWNPHVRRARRALDAAGVPYHYLGYGNYLTGWRDRLAIKLWSGWPTFPQVYLDGTLLGGADQAEAAVADGTLARQPAA